MPGLQRDLVSIGLHTYSIMFYFIFLNSDLSRSGAVPKLERKWPDLGENWSLNAGLTYALSDVNWTNHKARDSNFALSSRLHCHNGFLDSLVQLSAHRFVSFRSE